LAVIAFIGLGANLGDPKTAIGAAFASLGQLPGTRLLRTAPLYGSSPIGPPGQPDYVNTAAEIETDLEPSALLLALKAVERALGRTDSVRWGPRAIDLDILMYGDARETKRALVIPHPELAKRRFVLTPLADLAPDRMVPGFDATVRELLLRLDDDPRSVWRLA
jgi:2-amino-4-hydroxy-6-hydroxymethyldihydropteridine diphosphokinase